MSIPFGPLPFEMRNQLQILTTAMQHVAIIQCLYMEIYYTEGEGAQNSNTLLIRAAYVQSTRY